MLSVVVGVAGGSAKGTVTTYGELTPTAAAQYRRLLGALSAAWQSHNLVPLVEANLGSALNAVRTLDEAVARGPLEGESQAHLGELNRTVVNFLNALHMYHEHTLARLRREHGRRHELVDHFARAWASAAKSNLPFAVLCALRDSAQHSIMPFSVARERRELAVDDDGAEVEVRSFELGAERAQVLAERRMRAELAVHLPRLDEVIPVDEYLSPATDTLRQVDTQQRRAETPFLRTMAQAALDVVAEGFRDGGVGGIAEHDGKGLLPLSLRLYPVKMLAEMGLLDSVTPT